MSDLITKPCDITTPCAAGFLLVCCACGKTSTTLYGNGSSGWDESCMLNATEFAINRLVWNADRTRVIKVKP